MRKKILYLYSKTGGGHLASAQAITQAIDNLAPGRYEHILSDFIESTSWFMNLFARAYSPMVRYAPWSYGLFYHLLNRDLPLAAWEGLGHRLMSKKLVRLIRETGPQLVVSVHPEANHLTSRALRKLRSDTPFVIVVTDLVSYHKSWLGCTPYISIADVLTEAIVPTPEAHALALAYRCPADKLRLISLPLREKFDGQRRSRADGKFTVMLMGGGDGAGNIKNTLKRLLSAGFAGRLVVVTGKNQRLKDGLGSLVRKRFPAADVTILGFAQNVDELLARTDILVTKAGPGSIAEALVCGVPLIVNYHVPGQESSNCRFVEEHGLGFHLTDPGKIADKILHLTGHPEELREMKDRIERLGFKNGSQDIARRILFHLEKSED